MPEQALWRPKTSAIRGSNLYAYIEYLNRKHKLEFNVENYNELHAWSINNRNDFWQSFSDFSEIKYSQTAPHALIENSNILENRWFEGASLNFAENLLQGTFPENTPAIIEYNENGKQQSLSMGELTQRVQSLASQLKSIGVEKGDRIAACIPNCAESVIAMLASTSIGAIWASCSPDFGSKAMSDRFTQIGPKILFACQSYQYNGKVFNVIDNVKLLEKDLPSLTKTIWLDDKFSRNDEYLTKNNDNTSLLFSECITSTVNNFAYEQLPFSHPLYIMFSSGTTGKPKCIVHGAGGTLIQHLKEHKLHCDIKPGDKLFYFTTCGWMMWNWLVSALASSASIVLYDGSPFSPKQEILFDIAEQEQLTHMGLGAKYISAIEKAGLRPNTTHKLDCLRMILSTGSPLSHESYEYVYTRIKSELCLASISGGTDIISCFVLGNPLLPVYKGEIQSKGLGMDVDVFDSQQNSLLEKKGELVCKQAFPSMPIKFWNDHDGSRYYKSYFSQFDNCWAHGDFAEITANGGFIIHGRSDTVLNPGGVRIGTAEIYRQVEKLNDVIESVVVGKHIDDDVKVILFVVLRENVTLTDNLIQEIKTTIKKNASPRHVPHEIFQVKDIPKTKSGKIVELAIRDTINGDDIKNKDSLANPEALEYFSDIAQKLN